MKVANLLHLTEHHRCRIVRRFSLSPLDWRMLWTVYQPIIGAGAAALYGTLCAALPMDAAGEGEAMSLGRLFLSCGIAPNAEGRKRLVDETARLEAVGLLRTLRRWDGDEVTGYEFHLAPPLAPHELFGKHHLWFLLQECIGPTAAEAIRASLLREGLGEAEGERLEDISAPFSDVFRLSTAASTFPPPDAPAPDAIPAPAAAAAEASGQDAAAFGRDGYRSDELLRRFPRSSRHRRFVERLVADPQRLAALNYYAGKYDLTLKQAVSLLDEDGMFDAEGRWAENVFEARAAERYRGANERQRGRERTEHKLAMARGEEEAAAAASAAERGAERDIPAPYWLDVPEQFAGQCDVRQYNFMLANEPYTRVLKLFFEPSAVPPAVEEAFLTMSVNYKLPDEVINVMIHYIRVNDLDWKRKFLDAIAANVAGKRIRTFEHAVTYFRGEEQTRGGTPAGGKSGRDAGSTGRPEAASPARAAPGRPAGRRGRTAERPVIPVARTEHPPEASDEDIRRIMEMAKRLSEK